MRRFVFLLVLAAGCEPGSAVVLDPDAGTCDPSRDAFATQAQPLIERYCGACHGETPQYGAPSSLTDVDALLATRADGTRLVDRIAARLVDGTMPPSGMPRLPDADADAIARWASCGAADVPDGVGLRASAPVFLSPDDAPEGLATLDLTAHEYPVGPDVRDDYRCFTIEPELDGDRFVRRFEMIFDERRVLHHLVLLRDVDHLAPEGEFDCNGGSGMPAGSQYLYAWAPGTGAFQFPEGGLRISPGERFLVQIHYNNGAAIEGVRDSSGVRLYLDAPSGPEYGMLAVGPLDFDVPARSRETISSRCTFDREVRVLAGMPHMHQIGSAFAQDVVRRDGTEPLIRLEGWDFGTQLFYSMPVTLDPGDALVTRCTFDNTTSANVGSGTATADEMCFDFMYVTPVPGSRYCDEGDATTPDDLRYVPGECAPPEPSPELPLVRGRWVEQSAPPPLTAASVPDGRWALDAVEFYVSDATTPIGQIDLQQTYVLARGQVLTEGGQLTVDYDHHVVVRTVEGPIFGGPNTVSWSGALDTSTTRATIAVDCPAGEERTLEWGMDGDALILGFESESVPGAVLWRRYTFRRVP